MTVRKRAAIGIAALSIAALAVSGLAVADGAGAAKAARIPVIVVHLNKNIHLSRSSVHAGTVEFKAVTRKGGHELQIVKLHKGYSLQQAGQDLPKAFQGDVKAVRRVDHRITFLGGAEARPGKSGAMTAKLMKAGQYVLFDLNGNGISFLKVHGKPGGHLGSLANQGRITIFTYGFEPGPAGVPAKGWTRIYNHSDQPHFVEMMHVKPTTTRKQVHRFIKSGAAGRPSWALHGEAGSGVISPRHAQFLRWNIPAGKYLVACFWPDRDTGMPHFFMGMWRFVTVK